jgi:hypothetical protein
MWLLLTLLTGAAAQAANEARELSDSKPEGRRATKALTVLIRID